MTTHAALQVFAAMRQFHPNVRPNTVHFSSLISACATAGRWEEAMQARLIKSSLAALDNCHEAACPGTCTPWTSAAALARLRTDDAWCRGAGPDGMRGWGQPPRGRLLGQAPESQLIAGYLRTHPGSPL